MGTEELLKIIDDRIKKYINQSKLLKEYSGVIVNKNDNINCEVRIAGDETVFTFLNKTHEALENGDSVYIMTIGNDLNTGIISYKYGKNNSL